MGCVRYGGAGAGDSGGGRARVAVHSLCRSASIGLLRSGGSESLMLVRSIGGGGTVPTAQRMGGAKASVDVQARPAWWRACRAGGALTWTGVCGGCADREGGHNKKSCSRRVRPFTGEPLSLFRFRCVRRRRTSHRLRQWRRRDGRPPRVPRAGRRRCRSTRSSASLRPSSTRLSSSSCPRSSPSSWRSGMALSGHSNDERERGDACAHDMYM